MYFNYFHATNFAQILDIALLSMTIQCPITFQSWTTWGINQRRKAFFSLARDHTSIEPISLEFLMHIQNGSRCVIKSFDVGHLEKTYSRDESPHLQFKYKFNSSQTFFL